MGYGICACSRRVKLDGTECCKCRRSREKRWMTDEAKALQMDISYKCRYGISLAQYNAMLAAQGGLCAICHQPETTPSRGGGAPKRLAVDHDHNTGKVRALLCDKCNRAIGLLGDDIRNINSAAEYLASFM